MTQLTERKKADREKMAAMLAEAVTTAGGQATIDLDWGDSRELMVRIVAPGGAYVNVDFDGSTIQPDVHVATWNTPRGVFIHPAMGDVNPHHYGKATRVEHGIDRLIARLVNDIEIFATGNGYLDHDDDRLVAMAARYAERGWSDPRKKDVATTD